MDNLDEEVIVEGLTPFDVAMGGAKKISPPADFDGPVRSRRITDPLCLLFLFATWGVGTWIGAFNLQTGNYDVVVHPVDYRGRICGIDKDSDGKVLPKYWHPVDIFSNGVCVAECPTESNLVPTSKSDLICKDEYDLLAPDNTPPLGLVGCSSNGVISDDPDALVACGGCMYRGGGVKNVSDYCIPSAVTPIIAKIVELAESKSMGASGNWTDFEYSLEDWNSFEFATPIQRLVKDLRTVFPIFAGVGIGGTFLLGMLYIVAFLFPTCIAPAVWLSAGLIPAACGGGGALLFFLANDYKLDESGLHTDGEALFLNILAYTAWTLCGLVIIFLIRYARKINLGISMAKVASVGMRRVEMITVFAFVQFLLYAIVLGIFLLWFLMIAATEDFVWSQGKAFGNRLYFKEHNTANGNLYSFMLWFLIFALWWTTEFFTAIGKLTLSSSFAKWYYTPEKEGGHTVSVFGSLCCSLTKHAGTAAFGSLIIKMVQIVRFPIQVLQWCIKRSGLDNGCIDAIICSCQCCLFTIERFLKFTSKEAYIHTSMFGTSFCKSSHESFFLSGRNRDIVGECGSVGLWSIIFPKMLITLLVSIVSFVMMDTFYGDAMFSITNVTLIIAILAWYLSEIFMDVISVGCSTTLYCFLADEEIMGEEGSPFATKELDDFLALVNTNSSYPRLFKIDSQNTDVEGIEAGLKMVPRYDDPPSSKD